MDSLCVFRRRANKRPFYVLAPVGRGLGIPSAFLPLQEPSQRESCPSTASAQRMAGRGFPLLFNQNLNASQHIVHHHIGGRLDALGSSGLKINGADLIAQHDTLRLSS